MYKTGRSRIITNPCEFLSIHSVQFSFYTNFVMSLIHHKFESRLQSSSSVRYYKMYQIRSKNAAKYTVFHVTYLQRRLRNLRHWLGRLRCIFDLCDACGALGPYHDALGSQT